MAMRVRAAGAYVGGDFGLSDPASSGPLFSLRQPIHRPMQLPDPAPRFGKGNRSHREREHCPLTRQALELGECIPNPVRPPGGALRLADRAEPLPTEVIGPDQPAV